MLKFLKSLFSLKSASPTKKRAGFFEMDVEEEAVKLNLVALGKRDGAREIPASKERTSGVVENQIIGVGTELINTNNLHYEQEFGSYSSRLAVLTPEGMLSDAQLQSQTSFDDIDAIPNLYSSELRVRRENASKTQSQLKRFQHDNGLEDQAAHYPKSKILHISVIVVVLLLESGLNASLLARGNELGLLGGWTQAIIISLINVLLLGLLLCLSVRLVVSRDSFRKFGGMLLLLAFIAGAIGFNLLVVHYRNALGGPNPLQAGTIAYQSLLANPWNFGEVQSIMLFMIGVFVVFLAALDWLMMDDWHLGYGRITRAYVDALGEKVAYEQWLVHEKLQSLKDEASDVITRHLTLAASAASEDARVCMQMKKLNEKYIASVENLQTGVNRLLQIYREANKASRDTEQPASFEVEWKYPNELEIQETPRSRETPETKVFLETLQPLQNALNKKYQRALKSIAEPTL